MLFFQANQNDCNLYIPILTPHFHTPHSAHSLAKSSKIHIFFLPIANILIAKKAPPPSHHSEANLPRYPFKNISCHRVKMIGPFFGQIHLIKIFGQISIHLIFFDHL
jgi:hypothetical protein